MESRQYIIHEPEGDPLKSIVSRLEIIDGTKQETYLVKTDVSRNKGDESYHALTALYKEGEEFWTVEFGILPKSYDFDGPTEHARKRIIVHNKDVAKLLYGRVQEEYRRHVSEGTEAIA